MNNPSMSPHILFSDVNEPLLASAIDTLKELGWNIKITANYDNAFLELNRRFYDFAICGIRNVSDSLKFFNLAKKHHPLIEIIALTNKNVLDIISTIVNPNFPDHIIPMQYPFNQDLLISTIKKIQSKDIFGLDKYFPTPYEKGAIRIQDSSKKGAYIKAILDIASIRGAKKRMLPIIADALDEVIMNAIYDAPMDETGHKYDQLYRAIPVSLEENEVAILSYMIQDDVLAIAMTDPHGSLSKENVYTYFEKCHAKGEDQINQGLGGAGLGLYKMFKSVSTLIINLAKGKRTELILFFDLNKPIGQYLKMEKTFHIFTQGGMSV
ncbi:MAG: response regulator [Fibrobacteria bacterium]|nr:response regulator [Fibrobacteria bacterium]